MKSAVKALARRLGFEIRCISGIPDDRPPGWMVGDRPLPTDPAVPGFWASHALEMTTQAHRPDPIGYHRRGQGEDYRVKYVASFLDVRGWRTLELGPYEGFWSVLLEKMGVRENVGVELRAENVAKCERMKALHHLDRTRFVRQDIEALSRGETAPDFSGPFDLVYCVGLLYHVPDPATVLTWCRSQSNRLFLGTLYVEPAERGRYLPALFREAERRDGEAVYRGMEYREGGMADPVSGASAMSFWPTEGDLLAMLRSAGYTRINVLGKDILNRMPHITILAE